MIEPFAPVEYSPLWWVVLGVLIALFIAWLVAIPFLTRRSATKIHPELRPTKVPEKSIQAIYLERINQLGSDLERGKISERDMHLELSALVREFVSLRTGVRTANMTYSDLLEHEQTKPVANLIAQCYHPAFSSQGTVEGWNRADQPQPITVNNARLVVETL